MKRRIMIAILASGLLANLSAIGVSADDTALDEIIPVAESSLSTEEITTIPSNYEVVGTGLNFNDDRTGVTAQLLIGGTGVKIEIDGTFIGIYNTTATSKILTYSGKYDATTGTAVINNTTFNVYIIEDEDALIVTAENYEYPQANVLNTATAETTTVTTVSSNDTSTELFLSDTMSFMKLNVASSESISEGFLGKWYDESNNVVSNIRIYNYNDGTKPQVRLTLNDSDIVYDICTDVKYADESGEIVSYYLLGVEYSVETTDTGITLTKVDDDTNASLDDSLIIDDTTSTTTSVTTSVTTSTTVLSDTTTSVSTTALSDVTTSVTTSLSDITSTSITTTQNNSKEFWIQKWFQLTNEEYLAPGSDLTIGDSSSLNEYWIGDVINEKGTVVGKVELKIDFKGNHTITFNIDGYKPLVYNYGVNPESVTLFGNQVYTIKNNNTSNKSLVNETTTVGNYINIYDALNGITTTTEATTTSKQYSNSEVPDTTGFKFTVKDGVVSGKWYDVNGILFAEIGLDKNLNTWEENFKIGVKYYPNGGEEKWAYLTGTWNKDTNEVTTKFLDIDFKGTYSLEKGEVELFPVEPEQLGKPLSSSKNNPEKSSSPSTSDGRGLLGAIITAIGAVTTMALTKREE